MTFTMGLGVYLATYFGGLDVLSDKMTNGELLQFITNQKVAVLKIERMEPSLESLFMGVVTK